MLSLAAALMEIQSRITVVEKESVDFSHALGRVLRDDVLADADMPAFDRSAMDGYAVCGNESNYEQVGAVRAGEETNLILQSGQCARVFTGSKVPQGTTQVIMQEHVAVENNRVRVTQAQSAIHIRRRGEEAKKGDRVLASGIRLRPAELAILASVGATQPSVSRLPRVAHLVTGNELVDPEETPQGMQIRDSNSVLIHSLLKQSGLAGEITQSRLGDDEEKIYQWLKAQCEAADVLLISGGASVGAYDFARPVLSKLGFTLHFEQVDLRPGKPSIFATRGKQVAFAIPGNPVSHFAVFHLLIRPALEALAGLKPETREGAGRLATDFSCKPNARTTYWPAVWSAGREGIELHPLKWQSSGHVAGLAGATALLEIVSGQGPFRQGDLFRFYFV